MSQKFYRAQKVAIAVAAALSLGAQAEETPSAFGSYEIIGVVNGQLTEGGTLQHTQNSYGVAVDANGKLLGIAKGVNDGTAANDNIIGEVDDAILPVEGNVANAISRPFSGNNFLMELEASTATPAFVPLRPNSDVAPILNPSVDASDFYENNVLGGEADLSPRNNSYYYGVEAGLRFGVTTDEMKFIENLDFDSETDDSPLYFLRDFENRAFVQAESDNTQWQQIEPIESAFTVTLEDETTLTINTGGNSVISGVSLMTTPADGYDRFAAGYSSDAISNTTEGYLEDCGNDSGFNVIDYDSGATEGDAALGVELCVQNLQNNGLIGYQNRATLWRFDSTGATPADAKALPFGFEIPEDSTSLYYAQALGVNASGVAVGRGYRSSSAVDKDVNLIDSALWATFWDANGEIGFIGPTAQNDEIYQQSILEGINDNGYAIGTLEQWIDGYERLKFGYVDLNDITIDPDDKSTSSRTINFIQPRDFLEGQSDLSSRARSINADNQVVGYIEVDSVKQLPRQIHGFIYQIEADGEQGEFKDLNTLLTCESRGLEDQGDGNYSAHVITDTTSFSQDVTYNADIRIVDANHINDQGLIAATALITLPRLKTTTEEVFDEDGVSQGFRTVIDTVERNGEIVPVVELNGAGNVVTDQVPRAVLLNPISGVDSRCPVPVTTGLTPEPNVRQGAGFGVAWALLLAPLAWLRRRR